jgi:hypothetical protein
MQTLLKRIMPTFDVPLSLANSIYNLSITVLIGGTALVFFSALGVIWSGIVKERHAEEKPANINPVTSQANIALEKAKAELADAKQQLALANAATVSAQKEAADSRKEMERLKTLGSWRVITPDAREQFKTFTKTFAKGTVFLDSVRTNPEAADYAGQISDLLKDAGYTVVEKSTSTMVRPEDAPLGVQMKIKNLAAQPAYAGTLQRGLEYIGIVTTGELDDAAEDSVLIFVGNKP